MSKANDAVLNEWQTNLLNLPPNWTVDDIEARMPEKLKGNRLTYRILLIVHPLHAEPDARVESEWFVSLNYHEKIEVIERLDALVSEGKLVSYKFRSEPLIKKRFMDSILKQLGEVQR